MSLINQMLRDLEQRQVASTSSAQPPLSGVVHARPVTAQFNWGRAATIVGILILVGGGIFIWLNPPNSETPLAMNAASTVATPQTEPVPLPTIEPVARTPAEQSSEANVSAEVEPVSSQAIPLVGTNAEPIDAQASQPAATVAAVDTRPPPVTRKRELSPAEQARLAEQAAEEAIQSGRIELAIDQLQQALRLQPRWSEPRTKLANIYLERQQLNQAQSLLTQGLQLDPASAVWAMMQARILLSQDAIQSAIQGLEQARRAGADDVNLNLLLAALYPRDQRLRDAAEVYQQVLATDPQQGKAWLGLAIVLEGMGQPTDALSAFQQAQRSGGHAPQVSSYIQQRIAALSR